METTRCCAMIHHRVVSGIESFWAVDIVDADSEKRAQGCRSSRNLATAVAVATIGWRQSSESER